MVEVEVVVMEVTAMEDVLVVVSLGVGCGYGGQPNLTLIVINFIVPIVDDITILGRLVGI